MFKEHKRGKIIGTETGGAFQGNNSGSSEEVQLPETGLILSIPRWRYTNAVTDTTSRRGIIPDISIIPNRSWLGLSPDEILLIHLQAINSSKKKD